MKKKNCKTFLGGCIANCVSGRRHNPRKVSQFFSAFKLKLNQHINRNISFFFETGILVINCVPFSYKHKDSTQNSTKYEIKRFHKSQFPYSLVNWEKLRRTTNCERMCFPSGRNNFKPIRNSAHTTEFLTLRRFDLLMFYRSRELVK